MLSKREVASLRDEEPQIPDEGWWASVLADEDAHQNARQDGQSQATASNNLEIVDWERAQELFDRDEIVILQVHGCNRGGLLVQGDGLQGFVPVSHLIHIPGVIDEDERLEKLGEYVGRTLNLKVIECEPSMERIVLSERAATAGEGRRKQLFKSLKTGEQITGTVTNVTDFGVFVDLGGVEGLIHVSELSWGRVQHPADIVSVGEAISTLVLQICEENSRVALSLKRLCPNPWDALLENHKPGDIVPATITTIMRFGAFARLREGVEGLIHVSSIPHSVGQKDLEKVFRPGQSVVVRILHIDAQRRRLGLGLVSTSEASN
jgi:small subunit ribosomal protein S1